MLVVWHNRAPSRQDLENNLIFSNFMNFKAVVEIFLSTGDLSLLDSWGSLSRFSSSNWGNSWDESSEGSDNWGVVDDVVGGVGLDGLLDGDLGHVLHGVVDLVANMVGNWNRVGGDSWGSLDCGSWDNSLDSSNSWSSNGLGNWGSNSVDNRDSLANRVNKSVLVEVLRESFESQRPVSIGSGHEVTDSWGQRTGGCSCVDVRLGALGGGEAGPGQEDEADESIHVDKVKAQQTIPC